MNTRSLLTVTAVIELVTGLAFLFGPAIPVRLLLGADLGPAAAILLARVLGAALIAIGLACWLGRDSDRVERGSERGGTLNGLVAGLLAYNSIVAGLLVWGGVAFSLGGIALWPAVGLHALMALWCAVRIAGR